jgi:transposase-like protein
MKNTFDFDSFKDEAKAKLKSGETDLLGKGGVLTPLLKNFLEECLDGELEDHLDTSEKSNRKNGRGKKRVKTSLGSLEINPPRDRSGSFEPQLIQKRQTTLGTGLDRQIITLYSKGSSYEDISSYLHEMYDLEISSSAIGRITDKIIPLVQEWQSRPLSAVYPIVWLDAIHYKVREDGRVITKAVYSIIGTNNEGYKEVLGLYLGENEGARFWLRVLTDLQDRGVEDILIACIDNLNGFAEAIETVFPQTDVQLCVIHQVRNAQKYLSWKDYKVFLRDLKMVYKADTLNAAEKALNELELTWEAKYPKVIESWRRNWVRLSAYYKYPKPIRKLIYTTNPIESFHRQLRKITKTKGAFTSDNALMKLLYLGQESIADKWSQKTMFGWKIIYNQLSIIFEERMT